ncbi:MAG TPA: T9SS type A sorting domain-containing protein [Bacteroidota bacterium]|nr:T9SS type A sorting domain-containing protein [Bacteroidota bacterium]
MFNLPLWKVFLFPFFLLIVAFPLAAQQDAVPSTMSVSPKISYPVPGSLFLQKQEQEIHEYIRQHPKVIQRSNTLHKTSTWGFTVGSTHSWYADDLVKNTRYLVPSTCRAVGTNCYIFVEDANWTNGRVNQAIVDSVRLGFDARTPANGSLGIFQTDTAAFGTPPDVDNDPRIIILLLDIKDGYNGSGGYIAGYFYGYNEMVSSSQYPNSNHAEIYFLDVNPANLATTSGLTDGLSTTAHEFQHMIHFNYTNILQNNISRMSFINEGCSLIAEVNAGYSIYEQSGYNNETNHYLFDWRTNDMTNVLKDYSRAARFFTYIRDQVGIGVFKDIVNSALDGVDNLNDALTRFGSPLRFADILQNWFIANTLNDRTVDPKYGYLYPNLPAVNGLNYYNPNVPLTSDTIKNYAARYLDYKDGAQLAAMFTENNPSLIVKAVELGTASKRVLDVASGTTFSEPLFGTTYTEIHFIVMNTDPSNASTYTYTSSGTSQTVELKYDMSEPVGVLPLSAGDTVCVTFDAVQGGTLDSVRVALRRSSAIRAGIWTYTGTSNPTPLGQPLALNLTTSGKSTPTVYPVPWSNWGTIDLRSKNISTNSPFAVGFILDGAYSGTTNNYVMVTTGPLGNGATSFTYSSQGENGAQWYIYYPSNADTIFYYLVRAYVSFNGTQENDTTPVTPVSFHLNQNFPNPFNPTTTIQYQLPVQGFVTLTVYDMLGRKVETLLHQPMSNGTHTVSFNGSRYASGIYFYRIVANNFTDTKKMLLLK